MFYKYKMNEIEYFLSFSYEYSLTRTLAMTGEKTTKVQVDECLPVNSDHV